MADRRSRFFCPVQVPDTAFDGSPVPPSVRADLEAAVQAIYAKAMTCRTRAGRYRDPAWTETGCAHDAMIAVFAFYDRNSGWPANIAAFAHRVGLRQLANSYRPHAVIQQASEADDEGGLDHLAVVVCPDPAPPAALVSRENVDAIVRCVDGLPRRQRAAVGRQIAGEADPARPPATPAERQALRLGRGSLAVAQAISEIGLQGCRRPK